MQITTHLLTKNNEITVENSIKSLIPLNGNIIIGDMGSTDSTIDICKKFDIKIIDFSNKNRSECRNTIVKQSKTPWNFYIEPWECVASGHKLLNNLEPNIYFVNIFQNDVITKETRLWHRSCDLKFIQPIYETLNSTMEKELPGLLLYSNKPNGILDYEAELVEQWLKESPLAKEPYYYKAFILLGQKKYKEFLTCAQEYLFREKQGMPAIMMQYYLAMINLYLGDTVAASRGTVSCLANKPLMAEFWCLLGDIYYKIKQYKKAIYYYENAMILGKKRLKNDLWPIEIVKYKRYPEKMITSCKDILKNAKIIIRKT